MSDKEKKVHETEREDSEKRIQESEFEKMEAPEQWPDPPADEGNKEKPGQ